MVLTEPDPDTLFEFDVLPEFELLEFDVEVEFPEPLEPLIPPVLNESLVMVLVFDLVAV